MSLSTRSSSQNRGSSIANSKGLEEGHFAEADIKPDLITIRSSLWNDFFDVFFHPRDRGYALLSPGRAGLNSSEKTNAAGTLFVQLRKLFVQVRKPKRSLLAVSFLAAIALFLVWYIRPKCAPAWSSIDALQCHHDSGTRKLESLLARQSRTPDEAVAYYKSKYKRDPPFGFHDWVRFALEHSSPIIDDYDQIEADLLPFRDIPAETLKARSEAAVLTGKVHRASIINGKATVEPQDPKHVLARSTQALLEPIARFLPNVEFLLNWDDRQIVQGPTHPLSVDNMDKAAINILDRENAWDIYRKPCPSSTIAKSDISSDRPSIDLCDDHPEDPQYRFKHGNWNSDAGAFNTTFPVVSISKFSTFQDIVAPPWCYGHEEYRRRPLDKVPLFENKEPSLYWRGRTTGLSPSQLDSWSKGHRQRIIPGIEQMRRYSHKSYHATTKANFEESDIPNVIKRKWTKQQRVALSRINPSTFDVGFIQAQVCTHEDRIANAEECTNLEQMFPLSQEYASWYPFIHQFNLDIDGNAMSCRFYRLLDGGGLVFKQTIWAEWHDDRLVPYVHYVPVNIEADELPQYLDMMINTAQGRALAKKIADNGQKWASTALRKIDLSVAYYRLLLELADIYRTQQQEED
jgi:hypothetical protein